MNLNKNKRKHIWKSHMLPQDQNLQKSFGQLLISIGFF